MILENIGVLMENVMGKYCWKKDDYRIIIENINILMERIIIF